MSAATRLRALRNSAQLRLTVALTAVFLAGGTVLTGIAYLLIKARLPKKASAIILVPKHNDSLAMAANPKLAAVREQVSRAVAEANANAVHQILVYGLWSLAALTVLAGLSSAGGWPGAPCVPCT